MLVWCACVWLVPFSVLVPAKTVLAVQALGSPSQLSDVVNGSLYYLGDFEACVFERDDKYCLAEVQILEGSETSDLWLAIKSSNALKTHYRRDLLYSSMCVPRSVSTQQAGSLATDLFAPLALDSGVRIRVPEPACTTSDKPPWNVVDLVMGLVVLILLLLAATATAHDYFHTSAEPDLSSAHQSTGARYLSCFSLLRSWRCLADLSGDNVPLRCMQGVRAVTIIMFVNGHNIYLTLSGPIAHGERLEKTYVILPQMEMLNGHIMLSVMFAISGFLASYYFLKDVKKNYGFKMSILRNSYINRYLRLTPAYAFVVLLAASVLSRISTGPIWHGTVDWERDQCRRVWWINMLYLNNYIYPDAPCLLHTWYLAADLQLYCACTGLLAVAAVYPRTTKAVLGGGLLLSMAIPFVQTHLTEDLNPALLILPETIRHLTKDPTYIYSYVTAHNNLGPYMVGLIFGYIYTHIVKNDIKLTKPTVVLMWIISLTLPLTCTLGVYWYYQPEYQYGRLEAAIFASLNRVVYAAAIATAMLACSLGHGWLLNRVLSWTGFVIYARLGYCVYLLHFMLQTVQLGMTRQPVDLDTYFLLSRSVSQLVISFLLALLLHLFVELPFTALRKVLLPDHQKVKGELKEIYKTRRESWMLNIKTDESSTQNNTTQQNTFNNLSIVAEDLCQNSLQNINVCNEILYNSNSAIK